MFHFIVAVAVLVVLAGICACYRLIELRANLKFEQWKNAHSKTISRDAVRGSQAAVAGRVFERVAPYLPGFGYNPKDVRFIGDPVDFVVFDGLTDGDVRNVVFIEVKTGYGDLNTNERKVKAAVVERRVKWSLFRVPDGQPGLPDDDNFESSAKAPNNASQQIPQTLNDGRAALLQRGRF